jgi:hypothetical protein
MQEMYSKTSLLVTRDGGIHPPPEVLASWPAPNWINPEERGWEAPIILLIVLAITFLVYTARIWARLAVAKSMGLDDVLMSLAMLFVFGLTISVVLGKWKSKRAVSWIVSKNLQLFGFTASSGTLGIRQITHI